MKLAPLAVALAAVAVTACVAATPAPPPQLVYICQQVPCAHAQEFEVFDPGTAKRGQAPVVSVGEYTGLGTFGANNYLYRPGEVYRPSVTTSWTSPGGYRAWLSRQPAPRGKDPTLPVFSRSPLACYAHSIWIWPGGIDACRNGVWVRTVKL